MDTLCLADMLAKSSSKGNSNERPLHKKATDGLLLFNRARVPLLAAVSQPHPLSYSISVSESIITKEPDSDTMEVVPQSPSSSSSGSSLAGLERHPPSAGAVFPPTTAPGGVLPLAPAVGSWIVVPGAGFPHPVFTGNLGPILPVPSNGKSA